MAKTEKKYSIFRNFLRTPAPTLVGVLIVLVFIFSLFNKDFLTIQNFRGILNNFAVFGVLAAGVAIVMITGGFDLAIGSTTALVGMVSAVLLLDQYGIPTPVVILIAIAIGCLVGLVNGLLITKVGINPIITTLGTLAIIRGICYFWAKVVARVNDPFILSIGRKFIGDVIPYTTVYIIVIFIILSLIFKFTRFGRDIFTIGNNENLARLSGIPVDKIKIITYVLSGFFCSLAGLLLISQLGSGRPEYATGAELEVLLIVVLGGVIVGGGKGDLLGVFIALLLIQTISNGMVMLDFPIYLRQVVKGALLILAIAIDALRNRRNLQLY